MKIRIAILAACASTLALSQADIASAEMKVGNEGSKNKAGLVARYQGAGDRNMYSSKTQKPKVKTNTGNGGLFNTLIMGVEVCCPRPKRD
jgi:hypothetical protein